MPTKKSTLKRTLLRTLGTYFKKRTMTKTLTLFSILIILTACGDSKDKTDTAKKKEFVNQAIKQLAEKYNAVQGWDTLDFDYTIQYQDILSDSNKFILLDMYVDITDIYKKNNKYFVSGNCGSYTYPIFYFRLECTKSQINSLINTDISNRSDIGLITKITGVKKLDIIIGSEIDYDEIEIGENSYESIPYSYVQIEESDDFLLTGKLVDFYIKNRE